MITKPPTIHLENPPPYPQAKLEKAFIEAYLAEKGVSLKDLPKLSNEQVKTLMTEASIYASTKLAQIETRSTLLKEIHGKE